MARTPIAVGRIPAPDRTIAVHMTDQGAMCPMSRARVSWQIMSCPLGCKGANNSMIIRDSVIGLPDMVEAIADCLTGAAHLMADQLGKSVEISGHAMRTDILTISVDGGANEYELIIREVR